MALKKNTNGRLSFLMFFLIVFGFFGIIPFYQSTISWSAPAEPFDIENIKERYLPKGDDSELRVVRNRFYVKERRFELGTSVGVTSTDPFLSVRNFGGQFGYYFSEYISLSFVAWKHFTRPSSALEELENNLKTTANTNYLKYFYGGIIGYSPFYGKLSLLGKAIIYFDLQINAGLGKTRTETGYNLTPILGVGQQFYISKDFSLKLDYRFSYYRESVFNKSNTVTPGTVSLKRSNFNNTFTLGMSWFFGPFF